MKLPTCMKARSTNPCGSVRGQPGRARRWHRDLYRSRRFNSVFRDKVAAELEQLRPFRGHPHVVVLHNRGTVAHLDDFNIQGAMVGFFTPDLNVDLSALAVVMVERPGSGIKQRVLRGLRKSKTRPREITRRSWPTREELGRTLEVFDVVDREWGSAINEEHAAIRVYHNYYTRAPLSAQAFPGPHARHARLVPDRHDPRGQAFLLQEVPITRQRSRPVRGGK